MPILFSENHVTIGELLESKSAHHSEINTPKSMPADATWNPDPEASQVTGGYSVGFSLTVLQVIDVIFRMSCMYSKNKEQTKPSFF